MDSHHHLAPKQRLQLSALLLLLVGLCSIASPHDLKKASVHHRAPVHSSRSSRDLGRSRSSSSRTSAEAEVEPQIQLDVPRASIISTYTFASTPAITAVRHTLTAVALFPQPPPALAAPRMVCISCSSQDDPSIVSTLSFRPSLGRAPPLA
jgi:hypothetical protein